MRPIGFSTGAIAKGNFRRALNILRTEKINVVELSALRFEELEPLAEALPVLELGDFSFVSIHAPSRFDRCQESAVLRLLDPMAEMGYPVVVHPDVMFTPTSWATLGQKLFIENMDRRKQTGRTVVEMKKMFDLLPNARFCFDIGHARQVDPSMTEAWLFLNAFSPLLEEVHISEVNSASRHDPISRNAVSAFKSVAQYIPENIPIILEPLINAGQSDIRSQIGRAQEALSVAKMAVA